MSDEAQSKPKQDEKSHAQWQGGRTTHTPEPLYGPSVPVQSLQMFGSRDPQR